MKNTKTPTEMILEAVANAKNEVLTVNSFYVYTYDRVHNDLDVEMAINTYIEHQDTTEYMAIGVNFTTGNNTPQALDLINNKHGFAYICKDYEKISLGDGVARALGCLADKILTHYSIVLRDIDRYTYVQWQDKVLEKQMDDGLAKREAERIASLPYVQVGVMKRCKMIAEKNGCQLYMNDDALENPNGYERKYGYFAKDDDELFQALGANKDRAMEQFEAMAGGMR